MLVGHLLGGLVCECLAFPLHQAQSTVHGALYDKFDVFLDPALFRVGLGLSVFSGGFVAVAYPVVEGRVEVPLKKSSQPHPDPDEFAHLLPSVSRKVSGRLRYHRAAIPVIFVRSGPSPASVVSSRSAATWLKALA